MATAINGNSGTRKLEWAGATPVLNAKGFHDCRIVCDGGSVLYHRLILGASSHFLYNILKETELEDEYTTLILPDFHAADIYELLNGLLRGNVVTTGTELGKVLRIGELEGVTKIEIDEDDLFNDSSDESDKELGNDNGPKKPIKKSVDPDPIDQSSYVCEICESVFQTNLILIRHKYYEHDITNWQEDSNTSTSTVPTPTVSLIKLSGEPVKKEKQTLVKTPSSVPSVSIVKLSHEEEQTNKAINKAHGYRPIKPLIKAPLGMLVNVTNQVSNPAKTLPIIVKINGNKTNEDDESQASGTRIVKVTNSKPAESSKAVAKDKESIDNNKEAKNQNDPCKNPQNVPSKNPPNVADQNPQDSAVSAPIFYPKTSITRKRTGRYSTKLNKKMRTTSPTAAESTPDSAKIFKCDRCDYATDKAPQLKMHIGWHHDWKTIPCDHDGCSYVAKFPSQLKEHKRVEHEGIRYYCDKCAFSGKTKGHLKLHIDNKHKGIRYTCDQCDYSAGEISTLVQHKQAEHEGRRFYCDVCPYVSKRSNQLARHYRSHHTNEKFKCDQCDYSHPQKYVVTNHKQAEHGSEKFSCDLCDYTTGGSFRLKKHMRRKHGIRQRDIKALADDLEPEKDVENSKLKKTELK